MRASLLALAKSIYYRISQTYSKVSRSTPHGYGEPAGRFGPVRNGEIFYTDNKQF